MGRLAEETSHDLFQEHDFDLIVPEKKISIDTKEVNGTTIIKSDNNYDLPFERGSFETEKQMETFIKKIKNSVRGSLEYREWIDYIKNEMNINSCVITDENNDQVTIEIHHHPISMFSIVKAVLNDFIRAEQQFTSFDVMKEVMRLHYQNRVGYTALCTTIHEKFHNGYCDIPIESCQGDYRYLLKKYEFDKEDADRIERLMKITDKNTNWKE